MSVYYVDTSALAKRYVPEVGSQWVLSWILPSNNNVIVMAELASLEIFSLLNRRVRENTLSAANADVLKSNFLLHVEHQYSVIPLTSTILIEARELIDSHPLRTLDALQLACALHAASILGVSMTFISADDDLLEAAHAEGFVTDNPNHHP